MIEGFVQWQKMTAWKATKYLLAALTALHLGKDSIHQNNNSDIVSAFYKTLTAYRAIIELKRRNFARSIFLVLFLIKFKVNKRADEQTLYQMITDFVRFGWIGYRLPPSVGRYNEADFIKYGFFQRHIMERKWAEKLGPIVTMRGFNRLFVFVSDTDMVEQCMLDKTTYPSRGDTGITELVGKGLLGLPSGEMHTKHRRLIGTFFSNKWLVRYAEVIQGETQILVDKWTALCTENSESGQAEESNVNYDLSMLTLEVIMQACVGNTGSINGINQQHIAEEDNHEQHNLDNAMKEVMVGTAVPFLKYLPSPAMKHKYTTYAEMWKRAITRATEIAKNPDAPLMIHTALEMATNEDGTKALAEEEVYDEMNTVRAAGHETTSNTLSWAMLLLAQHPIIARKLKQEIDQVVQGTTVTFEETKQLPYTHMVIWETLRLYPTVPSFPREAGCDTQLGDYDIPKGSLVFVSQNAMNRNPELWPEPDKFIPERFTELPELKPSKPVGMPNGPKFGFIPFGAGNRTCIGQRLAMLEAVQILGTITKNFNYELARPGTPIQPVADITLGPKKGLYMKFSKRS